MPLRLLLPLLLVASGCSGAMYGCSPAREYPLTGQILSVDAGRQEVTVKHEDVPGFMPGMTMPFKVARKEDFDKVAPGDTITATLIVRETEAHLAAITRTGNAPLPAPTPLGNRPRILEPGDEAPDVRLIDHAGRERKLSDWRGKVIALTFIYTRCPVPNFCPLMDRNFASVQEQVKRDPRLSGEVHLLSVSFDPEYDTPEVLRAHAERVGADPAIWSYVTGNEDTIDPFAAAFGVAVMREDKPVEEILHNLRTVVIGRDGKLVTILNGNDWKPEELMTAIHEADGRQ